MKEKIFIIVKTYPNLSKKYEETVCSAGINEKGEWRRLFPVPFRKLPKDKQFHKYSWIEVEVEKAKEKLSRKESHKIDPKTIKIIETIDTKENWKRRNELLLPLAINSLEEFEEMKENDKSSICLVKPKVLEAFEFTPLEECRDWEKALIEGTQTTLFGEYKSPLEKIPWKFSYKFKCDDKRCAGHNIMCEDWELLEAWRSWKEKYKDEETLKKKIVEKFFDFMNRQNFHFVVGTDSQFDKNIIIGLYYPPRPKE